MHRCGTGILILLGLSLGLLAGCVGKGSSNSTAQGVRTVTLSPGGFQSVDIGSTLIFTATATNGAGITVVGTTIQFTVEVPQGSPNPAPLSILASGAACAGTWDSTGTICSPGSPGVAIVTATVEGVSSAPATVYVHQHIHSLQVSRLDSQGPPQHDCFSQGQTWQYQARAYDINNLDITNTVGPVSWSTSNANVLTVNTVNGLLPNQTQVTARMPGITQLFATVAGVTSSPMPTPFTTCLVSYVRLQIEGSTENFFSISSGSKTVTATAVDTLGTTLANPPLTWSSSNPEVASFSSATNTSGSNSVTARSNAGSTDITASCTPPSCNVGVLPGLPVYASGGNLPVEGQPVGPRAFGVIAGTIAPAKEATYTAWAATTQCRNGLNCQSFAFSLTPGTNPIVSSVLVPRTPNSMMFNEQSTRIYFGSDQGLMYLDVSATSVTDVSPASTPCHVSLCGKVLAISPDGNSVVVSDTISTPHHVYIYNSSSSSTGAVDLILSTPTENAIAAAFSPDESKVFILSDAGTMYVYSALDGMTTFPVGTAATDLAFSADGSFALVAGAPANGASGFATCNSAALANGSIVGLPGTPLKIFPIPGVQDVEINSSQSVVTENFVALEPPYLQLLIAEFTSDPLPDGSLTCTAPRGYLSLPQYTGFTAGPSVNLGQGNFLPLYMRITGNSVGAGAVIVAKGVPAVLFVDLSQQTTTAVPLANNGLPLAASSSTDGNQVYVAACDVYANNDPSQCTSGSVHIINRLSGGDIQQVPYVNFSTNNSMCTAAGAPPCFPDLIAVKQQ